MTQPHHPAERPNFPSLSHSTGRTVIAFGMLLELSSSERCAKLAALRIDEPALAAELEQLFAHESSATKVLTNFAVAVNPTIEFHARLKPGDRFGDFDARLSHPISQPNHRNAPGHEVGGVCLDVLADVMAAITAAGKNDQRGARVCARCGQINGEVGLLPIRPVRLTGLQTLALQIETLRGHLNPTQRAGPSHDEDYKSAGDQGFHFGFFRLVTTTCLSAATA